jgi:hypothetical protein
MGNEDVVAWLVRFVKAASDKGDWHEVASGRYYATLNKEFVASVFRLNERLARHSGSCQ